MKSKLLSLTFMCVSALSFGQFTTGTVALNGAPRTIKIDTNATTVTMTLTGPSTVWLGVGFNGFSMTEVTDMFIWNSTTNRDYVAPGGHSLPNPDAAGSQSWTITSDTVTSGVRTVVATRALVSAGDYTFLNNNTAINIIFAQGSSTTLAYHSTNPHDVQTLTRTALGIDGKEIKAFSIFPNPTFDSFKIETQEEISSISVYDNIGKLVQKFEKASNNYDISKLSKGVYFLEIISNSNKKSFEKIVKE